MRKKIALFVPNYDGNISGKTTHSMLTACQSVHHVSINSGGMSLLARNFNTGFLAALMGGFDYFVMLHSDIGASNVVTNTPWIDSLVQDCETMKCAVLSVVIPLKNDTGVTSLALSLDRTNKYEIRRVTMKELVKLPIDFICREDVCEIFGLDPDQAGALYINTGFMCVNLRDFDWKGQKFPGFSIDDRIYWSPEGQPLPYTLSEDWGFSLWVTMQGWPVFATKRYPATHFGGKDYSNQEIWGEEHEPHVSYVDPIKYEAGLVRLEENFAKVPGRQV